ncbi:DUF4902 domain-containing protein [Dyella sp.]|uniref:DUF4902 domain-containing protein n=1 Tax=Dyella sp. TaxID=1869338 RepID=UPI003F81AB1C
MADDGYLRLTCTAFLRLQFRPHMVWPDASLLEELAHARVGLGIRRAGHCEWIAPLEPPSSTVRLVSVGWAWMETLENRLLAAPGGIQSNLRLLSDDNMDLGPRTTQLLLAEWLDEAAWQESTRQALGDLRPRALASARRTWGSA